MPDFGALAYLGFTIALAVVLGGIAYFNYKPSRREAVEEPKFRMLDDNDE